MQIEGLHLFAISIQGRIAMAGGRRVLDAGQNEIGVVVERSAGILEAFAGKSGQFVGKFNEAMNQTYDRNGNLVGSGDHLDSLIVNCSSTT